MIKAQAEFFAEKLQIVTHREMFDTAELLEYGGFHRRGTVISDIGRFHEY